MSGFDLVPLDGGGPIHLPDGETVVGRGPFLGVSDKRISRHHGLLENLHGQLRLKPTHLNPCFSQAGEEDDPQPLERDRWHTLHPGDTFSLLPGKYIYRVVGVGGEDSTPRNSQAFQEQEGLTRSPAVSPEPNVEAPPPTGQSHAQAPPPIGQNHAQAPPPIGQNQTQTPPPIGPNQTQSHPPIGQNQGTPPSQDQQHEDETSITCTTNKGGAVLSGDAEEHQNDVTPQPKKRILPAWMSVSVVCPKDSSPKGARKKDKGPAAPGTSTKRGRPQQAREPELSEEEEEEEQTPRTKRRREKSGDDRQAQSKTNNPSHEPRAKQQSVSNTVDMEVDEGEGGETSTNNKNFTAQTADGHDSESEDRKSKNGRQTTAEGASSLGSDAGSASGPAPSKAPLRVPCPYGKDCYRKNPLHFQECSHPGDSDYEEEQEEEEEEEDLPECPYGSDCYRKNPLHRRQYKHTKRAVRTTRAAPRKTAGDEDDEDDDFGDEDSFINDDSEEAGDDSDYVPPESDDSGKEDIKQLQKEATDFLKKPK
ncbi:aprataxin and PNK-like factor isoform 1-T2 [Polymixia lowei]